MRHGDLNAAIARFEERLPGWWWQIGWCSVSSDVTIAPDITGPDADLLEIRQFDEGFDCDLVDGNICEALETATLEALEAREAVRSLRKGDQK